VTSKARGRAMLKFNADGFTTGCSPKTTPVLEPEPDKAGGKQPQAKAEDSDS